MTVSNKPLTAQFLFKDLMEQSVRKWGLEARSVEKEDMRKEHQTLGAPALERSAWNPTN